MVVAWSWGPPLGLGSPQLTGDYSLTIPPGPGKGAGTSGGILSGPEQKESGYMWSQTLLQVMADFSRSHKKMWLECEMVLRHQLCRSGVGRAPRGKKAELGCSSSDPQL